MTKKKKKKYYYYFFFFDIAIYLCENNSATLSLCRCAEYMHSLNKL